MRDYTPTTDEVAEAWASRYDGEHTGASGEERRGYDAEFDRWLAAHDREVAARAWDEGFAAGVNYDTGDWEHPPVRAGAHHHHRREVRA